MSLPSEIQIAPLDFDTIRAELRKFLQNQNEFRDYNFEGSSLAVLLDVLAYDAYYHGWYTNFAVNETFLQTAQIRNSVVAAARQLGYVPRSSSGAVATVDATVGSVNTAEGTITVSKFSPFTSRLSGKTYTFYPLQDYTALVNGASNVVFTGMELYEGTKLTQTFDVASVSNTGSKFELLNQNVDTRTISVTVKPSAESNTTYTFDRASSAVGVNASSNVYFLFETNNGTYDVQFGDGVLGRKLTVGQRVIINYLDTRGVEGNGANTFSYAGSSLGLLSQTTNVAVALNNVNIPAYGGASRESIESIKQNAPNIYQTQGRIITASDARAVVLAEVGGVDSIAVWGGEDNDPPTYGKMYIALKPANASKFGPTQKAAIIKNVLRPKAPPTLSFELEDPDYTYVVVNSQVRFSPSRTGLSAEQIRQAVVSAVSSYSQEVLGQFGSYFRYSQLSSVIDSSEPGIASSLTIVDLEKRLSINSASTSYTLDFSNAIYQPESSANVVSVTSKIGIQTFSYTDQTGVARKVCYLENSNTAINVYRDELSARVLVAPNVGSVDFETGVIRFTSFTPSNISTNLINELKVRVIPRNSDLIPTRTQIITIQPDNITVTVVEDLVNRTNTVTGRATAGGRLGAGSFSV